jgi:hypothetical protein
MITELERDQPVFDVPCPDDPSHFILRDAASPGSKRKPPTDNPVTTECKGCGEHHLVRVIQPWKVGRVSWEERNHEPECG